MTKDNEILDVIMPLIPLIFLSISAKAFLDDPVLNELMKQKEEIDKAIDERFRQLVDVMNLAKEYSGDDTPL
jgi:hypothetical protein